MNSDYFDQNQLRRPSVGEVIEPASRLANAHAAAAALYRSSVANRYHPLQPEGLSQGLLRQLLQLQSMLLDFTGMEGLSFAAVNHRQAVFACLAMVRQQHRRKSARNRLCAMPGVSALVVEVARELGFEIIECTGKTLPELADDQTAAVVLSLAELQGADPDDAWLVDLRGRGILVYVDGLDQYLLPQPRSLAKYGIDLLHLDTGLICGLSHGCGVVLAGPGLQECLPLPRLEEQEGQAATIDPQSLSLSIGRIGAAEFPVEGLLGSYAMLRMLGWRRLLELGWRSHVYLTFLYRTLGWNGDNTPIDSTSGGLRLLIDYSFDTIDRLQPVIDSLSQAGLQVDPLGFDCDVRIILTCRRLHQLSVKDFKWFAEQMKTFAARPSIPRLPS